MTKFITVDVRSKRTTELDVKELKFAQQSVGLSMVDHGVIARGVGALHLIGYVVYEYGLFVPPDKQHYFSIGRTLIAGNAVFYGVDQMGETMDLPMSSFRPLLSVMRFYLNCTEVEQAIITGQIDRPRITKNGVQIWQWPDPEPRGFRR